MTVGEYFAEHVITKVVEKISKNVDISKLNDHLRVLAAEGRKVAVKSKALKKNCKICNKELKTQKSYKCSSCKDLVHATCVKSLHDEATFRCGPCVVYPLANNTNEDDAEDTIEALKRDLILPITTQHPILAITHIPKPISITSIDLCSESENRIETTTDMNIDNFHCEHCDYTSTSPSGTNEHTCLEHTCEECDKKFRKSTDLTAHMLSSHRGIKRHRQDTSLLLDPVQQCISCDAQKDEITNLRESEKESKQKITQGRRYPTNS